MVWSLPVGFVVSGCGAVAGVGSLLLRFVIRLSKFESIVTSFLIKHPDLPIYRSHTHTLAWFGHCLVGFQGLLKPSLLIEL